MEAQKMTAGPKKKAGRQPQPLPADAPPFARRLREARLRSGLSLDQLAGETDVSARSIGYYEDGRDPSLEAAARLARYLGLSLDAVAEEMEQNNSEK